MPDKQDDLVARLRATAYETDTRFHWQLCQKAADRLELLERCVKPLPGTSADELRMKP